MKTYTLVFVIIITCNALSQTPQWNLMGLDGEEIYDIAVDDSGNVFVASWTGVFKSTDNGTTWAFKDNGLQIGDVYKLFIDYEGNIYLCGSASFPGYGLYKSSDGGENWLGFADTLNGGPINYFEDVTIIPNEPGGIIYVSNYYGVYRSTDDGLTWQSTNFTDPGAVDIGVNKNGYMFFGNNLASWFGIYRSTDLGLNWERHTFLGVSAMVYLRDGSVLASAYDPGLGSCGVYKTTDNGFNWVNTNTFSGLYCPSDFVLDSNDDIYASVGYVFLSTNDGNSWLNYGLVGQGGYSNLAIDTSGYIWAGSHLDGVYRAEGRTVPVELTSFSTETINNSIRLSWVTASEINNSGFEIEKSFDKANWYSIGFVEGNGTTTEPNSYSFVDDNIAAGTYYYRLKQIDYDGSFEYSNIIKVDLEFSISSFHLYQNYPNPFNPATTIKFALPEKSNVSLTIYNMLGESIKQLIAGEMEAGYHLINFDASELTSGVYLYSIIADEFVQTRKMIILK